MVNIKIHFNRNYVSTTNYNDLQFKYAFIAYCNIKLWTMWSRSQNIQFIWLYIIWFIFTKILKYNFKFKIFYSVNEDQSKFINLQLDIRVNYLVL